MKQQLLKALIPLLLSVLDEKLLKSFADTALDFVEDKVLGSKSTIDDAIVLPICRQIRLAFDIPDNDNENTD